MHLRDVVPTSRPVDQRLWRLFARSVDWREQLRRECLLDRVPPLHVIERQALHSVLREAHVLETPHGPVLVSPITHEELDALELIDAIEEDCENEHDAEQGVGA